MQKIKEMLLGAEKFADMRTMSYAELAKTVGLISLIPAIILAIQTYLAKSVFEALGLITIPLEGLAAVGVFISVIVGAELALFIGGILYFIFAKAVGGKGSYADTVHATALSLVPLLLLGWIPFLNIWAGLLSVVILVYALGKKHALNIFKATLAIGILWIILGLAATFGLFATYSAVQTYLTQLLPTTAYLA